jgi:hypothetical protein
MKRNSIVVIVFVGVFLCVLAGLAMAAQDKYTLKVPGGLSFSEFRGSRPGRLSPSVRTDPLWPRSSRIL